jgi:hypothetical protein
MNAQVKDTLLTYNLAKLDLSARPEIQVKCDCQHVPVAGHVYDCSSV